MNNLVEESSKKEKERMACKISDALYDQVDYSEFEKLTKGNKIPLATEIILFCENKNITAQEILDSLYVIEKTLFSLSIIKTSD